MFLKSVLMAVARSKQQDSHRYAFDAKVGLHFICMRVNHGLKRFTTKCQPGRVFKKASLSEIGAIA